MASYPKPVKDATVKRSRQREQAASVAAIRTAVFERDGGRCRVCGGPAESVHELRPRSLGGRVCLKNSIAVCGSGTTGCHGLLTAHHVTASWVDANGQVLFCHPRSGVVRVTRPGDGPDSEGLLSCAGSWWR